MFRKDIEPRCEYCRHGTALGENEIACIKQGITLVYDSCRKFKYDPLKRQPEGSLKPPLKEYSKEDFEL